MELTWKKDIWNTKLSFIKLDSGDAFGDKLYLNVCSLPLGRLWCQQSCTRPNKHPPKQLHFVSTHTW